jgi:hypothetical protein
MRLFRKRIEGGIELFVARERYHQEAPSILQALLFNRRKLNAVA